MRIFIAIILLGTLPLIGCSSSKKEKEEKVVESTDQTDPAFNSNEEDLFASEEIIDETSLLEEAPVEPLAQEQTMTPTEEKVSDPLTTDPVVMENTQAPVEPVENNLKEEVMNEVSMTAATSSVGYKAKLTSTIGNYKVKKGETLMMVSFNLYGDYKMWKEIKKLNEDSIGNDMIIKEGMVLNYYQPEEQFVWNPKGKPYLIQRGDTLVLISDKVYGNEKRWPEIYDNNKPLIQDPNVIFAGFTLYYIPDGEGIALK